MPGDIKYMEQEVCDGMILQISSGKTKKDLISERKN